MSMRNKRRKKVNLEGKSQWGMIFYRFRKNKLAVLGVTIIVILAIVCLSASLWLPYERVYQQTLTHRFMPPLSKVTNSDGTTMTYLLGTDQLGRDLFTRIIYGGQISLFAGLVSVGMSLVVGVALGSVAGYVGGKVDNVIMRGCDVLMAVPNMLMAMAIVAALGQGTFKMLIALSVAGIPRYARTTRASILTLRNQEYIEAAKCCGTSTARILLKHILPNGIGPVIVSATLGLGGTILSIASLGFLGIGIASPTPEWGTILSENRANIRYYPYLGLVPGMFICLSVISMNFIGDGLRDALDPRTKS
ncbi:MAG: ABC transporter permease [Christensenellales bacterium]|jgi:peptide/nickel transport system permease protein